ncbi:PAS domain-containing protein, partial [Paraburkholderia sp. SIMBA_009]
LDYTRAHIPGLRHDLLCDSMDEGKGIASAEHLWARLRRGEFFSGTCRYRTRSGASVWIEATYLPMRDESGEVRRIAVISRKSIADAER